MHRFCSIVKNIFERFVIYHDSSYFLRIYSYVYFFLFLVVSGCAVAAGGISFTSVIFWLAGLIAALPLALFITMAVVAFTTSMSSKAVDILYGTGRDQDNSEVIRNAEILKVIPLKEEKRYADFIKALMEIEARYGTSARLVYNKAQALIALGDLLQARQMVKEFVQKDQHACDDAYYNYCKELLINQLHPKQLMAVREGKKMEKRVLSSF